MMGVMGNKNRIQEIELDLGELPNWSTIVILLVVGTVGLMLIGRVVTPIEIGILSWSDWQLLKEQRVYRSELESLQGEVDILVEMLNGRPDPVETQLVARRMLQDLRDGHPALDYQRDLTIQAVSAVRDWSTGAIERDEAVLRVNEAIQVLEEVPER